MDKVKIGQFIANCRKDKKITQEQLAEILNMSTRQIQRIEKNEENTTIKTLKRLRKILEIPDQVMVQVFYSKEELEHEKTSILL